MDQSEPGNSGMSHGAIKKKDLNRGFATAAVGWLIIEDNENYSNSEEGEWTFILRPNLYLSAESHRSDENVVGHERQCPSTGGRIRQGRLQWQVSQENFDIRVTIIAAFRFLL